MISCFIGIDIKNHDDFNFFVLSETSIRSRFLSMYSLTLSIKRLWSSLANAELESGVINASEKEKTQYYAFKDDKG